MFKHQLGLELMFFFVPSSESIICLNGQKIATKEMDLECERVTKSQGKGKRWTDTKRVRKR